MFQKKMNAIRKLGEIQCTIYEFSTAIFLRENTIVREEQMEQLSNFVDNNIIKNTILENDNLERKNTLLERYEKIVRNLLEMIEAIYANALDKMQQAEAEQNVIYIKKATLEHFLQLLNNAKTDNEKNNLINAARAADISLKNLDNKIYLAEEKIKQYDKIILDCENEIKISERMRECELDKFIKKLLFNQIENISLKNVAEKLDILNNEIEELERKSLIINTNIENHIINFISKIDILQNKILE